MLTHEEVKSINTALLIKLCKDVNELERRGTINAKKCTLIINDAIIEIEKEMKK